MLVWSMIKRWVPGKLSGGKLSLWNLYTEQFMSQSTENIEAVALKLPRNERARVALHLLDSLEQDRRESTPAEIESAWIEESLNRLKAHRDGEMASYPVEDVIAELEKSAE